MTRRQAPRCAFDAAAKSVLPSWEVSLVFVGDARAKSMNESLRGKSYVPNVLSYEAGVKSGEIVICLPEAARQAKSYEMSYPVFVLFLFIHGLMHLKGRAHGPTMEKAERALLKRLASSTTNNDTTKNRNGHRPRNAPDESRRR